MSHFYESHDTYATFVTCLLLRHAVMKSTDFINNYSFHKKVLVVLKLRFSHVIKSHVLKKGMILTTRGWSRET